jgi:hypothetical protein
MNPAMHPSLLPALRVAPKTGDEPFLCASRPTTLLDFWRWYASSLLDNGLRSGIAEFIVASAVGDERPVRDAWASHDVLSAEGIRIEVKSTCAVQTWKQDGPSKPIFTIRPARAWSQETGVSAAVPCRSCSVYVFCVLAVDGDRPPDPLDVRLWRFYVLPTGVLNERAPKARTVTLGSIQRWGAREVGYARLAGAVREVAGLSSGAQARRPAAEIAPPDSVG